MEETEIPEEKWHKVFALANRRLRKAIDQDEAAALKCSTCGCEKLVPRNIQGRRCVVCTLCGVLTER